jgi:hypothetical protein
MMMKSMFGRFPWLEDAGEVLEAASPLLLCAHTTNVDSNNTIPMRTKTLGICFTSLLPCVQTAMAVNYRELELSAFCESRTPTAIAPDKMGTAERLDRSQAIQTRSSFQNSHFTKIRNCQS